MTDHLAVLEQLKRDAVGLSREDHEALRAAIALMRGQSWQDIATCPRGDRRVILLISVNGPNGYVTDPWTGWRNSDGTFARWPHEFPPSHWRAIEPKYPSQPKDTADDQ